MSAPIPATPKMPPKAIAVPNTASDTRAALDPLLMASYGASRPCSTCGHVPPPAEQELNAMMADSWRRLRERLRRFVLEELDRNRPHGVTNDAIACAHQHVGFRAGEPCGTQPWDVTYALEHLESHGAVKVYRRWKSPRYAVVKARLTISRAELATRLESLIGDAAPQKEL